MGGYERNPAALALDGIPADFNGKLLPPDWPRFEEISAGAVRRVPAMADAGVRAADQRPGGLHPGQRVHPRRVGGARLLRGGRLQRPRHRRRRRPGPAGGALDRGRRAGARPVEDGHPPLRRSVPLAGLHAGALDRELRHLLRHPLPVRGAPGRPAAAPLAHLPAADRAGLRLRREVRLGAAELVRVERRRRRRGASPARAGRGSTGRRPSARRRSPPASAAALFDETSFAKIEIAGSGALAFLAAPVRQRHGPARSAASPTPRCSTSAAGSSATSPSPAWRRIGSASSPAPPSATTTSAGSAATRPTTAAWRCATSPPRGPAWASGGPRPARSWQH